MFHLYSAVIRKSKMARSISALDRNIKQAHYRLLILTSRTGGGHNARARAISEWIGKADLNEEFEIHIEEILENSSIILKFGVAVYNFIQRRFPRLHHIYWHITEAFIRTQSGGVKIGGVYYRKLIADYKPHIIISVHDSTNRGYFEDAKTLLGNNRVTCITYCGEWSGGRGYSQNWLNPIADRLYSRTEEAREYAIQNRIPPKRISVFCNLLSLKHFNSVFSVDEKRKFRSEKLKLDEGSLTLLFSTGINSANEHLKLLNEIVGLSDKVQAIVICGRSKTVMKRLLEWQRKHNQFKLHVEGYSNQLHSLMEASDAVISRGGSNTAAEALFHNCPLIFDLMTGTMPQEELTHRYFLKKKAAVVINKRGDLAKLLASWIRHPDEYNLYRSNLSALKRDDHPEDFVKELMASARIMEKTS